MSQRAEKHVYRLFGSLWLEPPTEYLSPEELERLETFEPLIRELESQQRKAQCDIVQEFASFASQETKEWRLLGVERPPEMLLHPSGNMDAPVACHLHNPTFYVKDPFCRETENRTNPTIQQINQAGFTSEKCFIFDHICRRDRTEDVVLFYSQNLYTIHENFMLSLRSKMTAKVEICWGKHVRMRMQKLLDLVPLRLWGVYREIEVFLELKDSKLTRFIIFVAHPQFFFYHGSFTQSGILFRKTLARKQDMHLAVAGKLGQIEINESFYEINHRPALYGQFKRENRETVRQMEADADSQLKKAFPEKYQELEAAALPPKKKFYDVPTQTSLPELIKGNIEDEVSRRHGQIVRIVQDLLKAASEALGADIRSIAHIQTFSEVVSEWDSILHWDQIPSPFVTWIQQQAGLKIDQQSISTREELARAYHLLSPNQNNEESLTLMQTVIQVSTLYIARIRKQRHESVRDLIIPGKVPYNIIRRRCSRCGERVLDDAFASYAKNDPKKYVIWYRLHGCGSPICRSLQDGTHFAYLIPMDHNQGYKIATRRSLKCLRSAHWEDYLLRCSDEERQGLLQQVHTKCNNCGVGLFLDTKPRWTAEASPRYVVPVRRCESCKKRFSSFAPENTDIVTISKASLSKKWSDLRKGNLDPMDYPRRPAILWSRKSHLSKRRELERERDLEFVAEEPDIRPQQPIWRTFNSKRRARYECN